MTIRRSLLLCALAAAALGSRSAPLHGEIPKPTDAPAALPAAESAKTFHLPEGFRLELAACEPTIHEPSGVCWDASGRLFVCELHGYNMAGQFDIEELNKTGELDHVVRRIDASDEAKKKAAAVTYGSIKHLIDTDGDGRADKAELWADRLPACHGICPSGDGIIAICAPHIMFFADRDGDGHAEVQQVLFTGFPNDQLERSISCPQWAVDGWIHAGRGSGPCTVTGPGLKQPVDLPHTDFRFKADGSAIEPVAGSSYTMGFAITEEGDRYTMKTFMPAIFAAPIPWHYLRRNPHVMVPSLEQRMCEYTEAYPTAKPHPWRSKRADDPGFSQFYRKRYGIVESAADGYFTSLCCSMVYQGHGLPGLRGEYFICEPSQNLVHRGLLTREGIEMRLTRAPQEQHSEFLTSTDAWCHPIALSHGPDDNIYITDFYREIIEDYSAVPRYLQQQYELKHGEDRGRIWRLTHRDAPQPKSADMQKLSSAELVGELSDPVYWRRETARRLLLERADRATVPALVKVVSSSSDNAAVLGALYLLDSFDAIDAPLLQQLLAHSDGAVRVHALRMADKQLKSSLALADAVLRMIDDSDARVQLQLALTLGELSDPRVLPALAQLAREHGEMLWMPSAILSSLSGRGGEMLSVLLGDQGDNGAPTPPLGQAVQLLEPLCGAIASQRDQKEFSQAILQIVALKSSKQRIACLQGIQNRFQAPIDAKLTEDAGAAIASLAASRGAAAPVAQRLMILLRLESADARQARIEAVAKKLADVQLPTKDRLQALTELSDENGAAVTDALLAALPDATPELRTATMNALFANRERLPRLLDAVADKSLPKSALSAMQRTMLLESADEALRARAKTLLEASDPALLENLPRYTAALKEKRDVGHGEQIFRDKCASCHAVRGIGFAVGPDLAAEFQRAEETIVRDILAPSEALAAGYVTYIVLTKDDRILTGLITGESANSITLKQPGGKEQSILRQDIESLKSSPVSIMPEDLSKTLSPQDVADCIAWLKNLPK